MIKDWIRKDFPYRPGAGRTGDRFGLRFGGIGSPYHPGDDRSGNPRRAVMCFDGTMTWKYLSADSAFGSITKMIPDNHKYTELQIAHMVRKDKKLEPLNYWLRQGEELPVIPGDIGLSDGIHTHTEWWIKYTDANYAFFKKQGVCIRDRNSLNTAYIYDHCRKNNLDPASVTERLVNQFNSWGISEAWTTFCIRDFYPAERTPSWGRGAVIIADPMLYLDI